MAPTPKPRGKAVRPRVQHVTLLPGPKLEPPAPPRGLLRSSRDCWFEFWASDVSQTVDRNSDMGNLERWIVAVDEYERAMRVFKTARLVKGSAGQITLNPLAGYMVALDAQIAKSEHAFGMTPLSRLRLGIALGEAHKSLAEFNASLADANGEDDERFRIVRELYDDGDS